MSNRNNKLHSLFTVVKRPLLVLLAAIAPVMTQYAQAGTLGGSTSFSGAWGWTFSYEIMQFTRANITLEDGTIIAAPTFDITENPEPFEVCTDPALEGSTCGKGSALFKGILKVTHGPEVGEAWAEVQMKWPEVDIIIDSEPVEATVPDGDGGTRTFTFYKESRTYRVLLQNPDNGSYPTPFQPGIYADKLTDGYKQVVPGLGTTGVYDICDDPDTDDSHLCFQEIGYGTVEFDPTTIFQPITAASGLHVSADTGFYWDEVCLAFLPGDLGVTVEGQDFNLKEDDDGYFRSCEGRSVVFNACTPDPEGEIFNCNDTNGVTNEDGEHFTLTLADAAAGDRLEPAPATTCVGTEVADWLALDAYAGTGEDVVITPCEPNQGFMLLPFSFSDSSIEFTSSEGDNALIENLQIISIATRDQTATTLVLEESPDKTDSNWDFSNMLLKNISSISSLELDDTITGSAGTDVILGGNGKDQLFGFSGDDCLDGGQNNDNLWGDGHAEANDQGSRGADIFVLTSKLGKDAIRDFNGSEGDVIVNVSGSPSSTPTPNGDGTYTVALKGQNFVTVHVVDGEINVVDQKNLSGIGIDGGVDYSQCSGHPAY
jgi:hypothetical protein